MVLTGAGCSTESGIPDYRDNDGAWKRRQPMQLREFLTSQPARQRYWARSLVGWERIVSAQPNSAHFALAELERNGRVAALITQNVDGLHQAAGSRAVIDLHGRLDTVECLTCHHAVGRGEFQRQLERMNPGWRHYRAGQAPDGDADLAGVDFSDFRVPACAACGGVHKPAVVFFGESVPRARVQAALHYLEAADLLLVAGSSLMVWSGYRFAKQAHQWGIPVVAVNLGRTRADDLLRLKVIGHCSTVMAALAAAVLEDCAA